MSYSPIPPTREPATLRAAIAAGRPLATCRLPASVVAGLAMLAVIAAGTIAATAALIIGGTS